MLLSKFLDPKNDYTHVLKDFSFTFLELPKFNKKIDELNTLVDKWAYFFKHANQTQEVDLKQISGEDVIIRDAYEVLNQFSWSSEELNTYEQEKKSILDAQAILDQKFYEGKTAGLAEGKAVGIAEGQRIALLNIIKNLSKKGLAVSDIKEMMGLSPEEIESFENDKFL